MFIAQKTIASIPKGEEHNVLIPHLFFPAPQNSFQCDSQVYFFALLSVVSLRESCLLRMCPNEG